MSKVPINYLTKM